MAVKIKHADPNTFELLKEGYSKDKNLVFLDKEIVIHANPQTFQLLEFPYSKDDGHIFCGTIPLNLEKNEVQEFKVTNTDRLMSDMKTSLLISSLIKEHPEYEWLDTLGIKIGVLGQWGTGETINKKLQGIKEVEE